jgi:hypothetical protein
MNNPIPYHVRIPVVLPIVLIVLQAILAAEDQGGLTERLRLVTHFSAGIFPGSFFTSCEVSTQAVVREFPTT